jgi:hypothetical protein
MFATRPNNANVAIRHRNFERSLELLRRAEVSLVELQSRRGEVIALKDVEAEISQALEMLAMLHRRMPSAIIEAVHRRLPNRTRLFRLLEPILRQAVEEVRSREEHVFRNLSNVAAINGAISDINGKAV